MTSPVADYGDPSLPTVTIDGYGRSFIQDLTVQAGGRNWRFIFDADAKRDQRCALALCLDRGVWLHGAWLKYPRSRRVFALVESPNERHFGLFPQWEGAAQTIFTHEARLLSRGRPYRRLDYGTSWIDVADLPTEPVKQRLASFIGSLSHPDAFGYILRKEVARRLQSSGIVECFGRGIREVERKSEALAPFAFSVAMENTQADYYYTEKLIDCFVAGVVPIYWGCPGIGQIFDPRGMLLFQTYDDLEQILSTLSWEKYEQMRPYVLENRRRVQQLQVGDYRGHYERLAAGLADEFGRLAAVPRWRRSKAAAGWRFLCCGGRRPGASIGAGLTAPNL